MRAMGTLSAQLAESERAARALEQQLESTLLENNGLRDQIKAVNTQVSIENYCPAWLLCLMSMHVLSHDIMA